MRRGFVAAQFLVRPVGLLDLHSLLKCVVAIGGGDTRGWRTHVRFQAGGLTKPITILAR
jgi:hypothetical protein